MYLIKVALYNIDPHHTSKIMATLHEKFHKFMNEMDFISQDKAHSLMRAVIVVVAVVSYIVAASFQKFSYCVYSILIAMALLVPIVVPGGFSWWKQPPRSFAKPGKKTDESESLLKQP